MKDLFDGTVINGMELRNRIVRSATWEGMCDQSGRPTPRLAECYQALARGRAGLIITGYAYVRPDGKQMVGSLGAHSDDHAALMRGIAAAVHVEGGRLCLQLVHCGGQARPQAGRMNIAPSAVETPQYSSIPAAMDRTDIEEIIAAFGQAARRAQDWGFDAVQIHAAHGYLINQFLSPHTNRRSDAYGGSLANRARFLLEVCRAVRSAVGPKFPVLVKLTGSDFLPGGLTTVDAVSAAAALDAEGVDAIEVSGGTPASGAQGPVRPHIAAGEQEAYNLELATRIKRAVTCPVMVVGGLRSFAMADGIIRNGGSDYVSLSRPFIREPGLVKRWQEGDRTPARCISCNGCYRPGMREGGIACVVERAQARQQGPGAAGDR
jgi:2,4-dienoyl-CoA reductase-like NADH-dependent reductase (Old Yellow Enzyme family)